MKSLLLCTDGSAYAAVATQYAANLAKTYNLRIEAVYVTDVHKFELPFIADFSGSIGAQPYDNLINSVQQIENEKARVIEDATRQILSQSGIEDITFHHPTGILADHIEELEKNIDLVIMGKRGAHSETAMDHIGSTTERVVRASSKPCLITSRAPRELKQVLLAYDGSPSSQKALDHLNRDHVFHNEHIHVVSIIDNERQREDREALLEEAKQSLKTRGIEAHTELIFGCPEDKIAEYVSKHDIDLLLIGAYGHGIIRYLLIGSCTRSLLQLCHIPILCFR